MRRSARANAPVRGRQCHAGHCRGSDDPILLVDNGCDVQILVRIDAADDATFYSLDDGSPSLRLWHA